MCECGQNHPKSVCVKVESELHVCVWCVLLGTVVLGVLGLRLIVSKQRVLCEWVLLRTEGYH